MKIFRFVKKVFFVGLTILSNFTDAIPLNAIQLNFISMKNQECKTRLQVVNVNSNNPIFTLLVLKRVNVVVIVIILTIHIQTFVYLTL